MHPPIGLLFSLQQLQSQQQTRAVTASETASDCCQLAVHPLCRAASTLIRRLEQTHTALLAVKHMLPSVAEEADVLTAYELTHQSMEQFIVNTHTDWFNTIDNSISKQLQANLLVQDKADRKAYPSGRHGSS